MGPENPWQLSRNWWYLRKFHVLNLKPQGAMASKDGWCGGVSSSWGIRDRFSMKTTAIVIVRMLVTDVSTSNTVNNSTRTVYSQQETLHHCKHALFLNGSIFSVMFVPISQNLHLNSQLLSSCNSGDSSMCSTTCALKTPTGNPTFATQK